MSAASDDRNILIIAFDGLDYELIQRYDCDNLQQEEFGQIDNTTGMHSRKTSELFASFITGELPEKHGVKGYAKWDRELRGKVIDLVSPERLRRNVRGFHRVSEVLKSLLGTKRIQYTRDDLEAPALFDEMTDAEARFVPSYNPSWLWMIGAGTRPLEYGATRAETAEVWEREFRYRKQVLFEDLDSAPHNLLMIHFHKPDILQHLYAYDDTVQDEDKIESLYSEMDDFAAAIKERAADSYDTVLFLSDHGLPTSTEHNKNAFYSLNEQLDLKTPHISDFKELFVGRNQSVLDLDI